MRLVARQTWAAVHCIFLFLSPFRGLAMQLAERNGPNLQGTSDSADGGSNEGATEEGEEANKGSLQRSPSKPNKVEVKISWTDGNEQNGRRFGVDGNNNNNNNNNGNMNGAQNFMGSDGNQGMWHSNNWWNGPMNNMGWWQPHESGDEDETDQKPASKHKFEFQPPFVSDYEVEKLLPAKDEGQQESKSRFWNEKNSGGNGNWKYDYRYRYSYDDDDDDDED